MRPVLSVFTFGVGALLFVAFITTLKPTSVTAASAPNKPGQYGTSASPSLAHRSVVFATALWPDLGQQK